ncbi:MAG: GNAT family N-acetyltransferase [Chloroflexi bacterium]|nr:GNAT family N-acetyltransferase [Chloroflexota bacterium]
MTEPTLPLTIRPLCASDLDRIFDYKSRPFGEKSLEQQASSEVYVAVAELDGVPVGRVGLDFTRNPGERTAYLWSAHVEPGFQSRGIGTALFLHLEQVALQRGFNVIQFDVDKENPRARRLYEQLGYAVCSEVVVHWSYRDGDRVVEVAEDCWSMRKNLAVPPRAD